MALEGHRLHLQHHEREAHDQRHHELRDRARAEGAEREEADEQDILFSQQPGGGR